MCIAVERSLFEPPFIITAMVVVDIFPKLYLTPPNGLGPFAAQAESGNTHFCIGPGCSHCATMGNTNFTCQATDLNMSAVRQGYLPERAAGYSHINQMPECHMSKFSMKLDRATPVDIPQDFMNRVRSMFEVRAASAPGYVAVVLCLLSGLVTRDHSVTRKHPALTYCPLRACVGPSGL